MNTAGQLYQCQNGHQQYLPYRTDHATSWCEPCRKSVPLAAIRTPAGMLTTAADAPEIRRIVSEKFRNYETTWDATRQGQKVVLEPDAKNDREQALIDAMKVMGFQLRHIAGLRGMDTDGMALTRKVQDALQGSGPRFAILWGPYGTGKTQTAAGVAMLRFHAGQRTRYVTAPELTRALRDNFETKVPEAQLLRKFHDASGLVVDEIQAALDEDPGRMSWARTQIQGIVDTRYGSAKPLKTILICNADSEETLTRRLGAHIISRVQECGKVFEVSKTNYRAPRRKTSQPYADQ